MDENSVLNNKSISASRINYIAKDIEIPAMNIQKDRLVLKTIKKNYMISIYFCSYCVI